MELTEISSGKFFRHLPRPIGAAPAPPFRVRFETIDLVDAQRGHHAGAHVHAHYEIFFIDAGDYTCAINDVEVVAKPGSVVVVKPGDRHADFCPEPVRFRVLRLRVEPGPSTIQSASIFDEGIAPLAQVVEDRDQALSQLADRLIEEASHHRRFVAEILDLLAAEFVWTLLRRLPAERLPPALAEGMQARGFASDLQHVFEEHLGRNLGLRELAHELDLSERTLTARCRSQFGESPTRLFVRHKMDQARVLLAQTDLPIKEISAHFGFENPYHFSTVYKRVHGVAPTAHRT
jgi:AraC-like DNA-binding protein